MPLRQRNQISLQLRGSTESTFTDFFKEQIRCFLHICGGKFKTTEHGMLHALGSGLIQENSVE